MSACSVCYETVNSVHALTNPTAARHAIYQMKYRLTSLIWINFWKFLPDLARGVGHISQSLQITSREPWKTSVYVHETWLFAGHITIQTLLLCVDKKEHRERSGSLSYQEIFRKNCQRWDCKQRGFGPGNYDYYLVFKDIDSNYLNITFILSSSLKELQLWICVLVKLTVSGILLSLSKVIPDN